LLLTLAAASAVRGVETAFWQIGTFDEFLQGTLRGISLSKEGELRLAPESRTVFSPEEALALSLARDPQGNLFVGTGHQGKVFRVDAHQKASLFFTAQQPDVFAMAVGPDEALYVGSSPEGKVYRVTPDGKSRVFYDPKMKYIWALVFDSAGRLYVATGDKGQIFRVDSAGKGELFFDSKQTHIMCLILDRAGSLLAGSVPNGLVYRITPQGKGFVLYQASLPEIHDLATDSEGRIYAAALGGAAGRGTPETLISPPSGGPASGGPAAVPIIAPAEESKEARTSQVPPTEPLAAPSLSRAAPSTPTAPALRIPQGRGSLIEIFPDSTVETIWSSNNESIFGLAVRDSHVVFSTDSDGRIFDLDTRPHGQRLTLLTETRESLATRLMLEGPDLYIATSNIARLFRVEATLASEGSYESPVKDTKFISRWGVLTWRGEFPPGTSLEFFTRSGNNDRPDQTWADWAGPYRNPAGSPITSPPARYLQWKAVFRALGTLGPTLGDVTVSYLNQNLPPEIRSLSVSTAGERTGPMGATTSGAGSMGASLGVGPPTGTGLGPHSFSRGEPSKIPVTLTWQADDPNGDQLVYALYVRAADEQEWHLIRDKLRQTTYTLDPNTLADGKYVARLVASDEESNPPEMARTSELLSAPFWVDNTPPVVRVLGQTVESAGAEVRFEVEDSISPLRGAETSIDGKEWRDVLPEDGIVDSRKETFKVRVSKLEPGEHILSLRAYDTAGNVGVGKAVVRIPREAGPLR
jgi:outer membrane protein assembly factor BamB